MADFREDDAVTIEVPSMLRQYSKGASKLYLAAVSVGDALGQLEASHPLLYRSVCDESGAVRRHVNVFVNTSNIRDLQALDTPLAPGDTMMIIHAVSGG